MFIGFISKNKLPSDGCEGDSGAAACTKRAMNSSSEMIGIESSFAF